ncbi:MAG: tRNA (N(6)-L-threonylcarbamoyladenosine(37)-C(2))-methylthiotransferase MtaB [Lachnospiraceae bacterium]|nr:tRNA (N(6)-L-threonylcarbamoyladenosine(37)-C(2))-methylthiotransferase MtaB [Lachnospiraceae bacterium]
MDNYRKSIAFHNLGCKVNAYEMSAMILAFEQAGYTIVPFEETADIYVVNTCSVTNIADRKSRQMLHRAAKQNPDAVIVAVGCYAQASAEDLTQDPLVHIIVGNNRKADIVSIVENYLRERENAGGASVPTLVDVIDIAHEKCYENMEVDASSSRNRAYIKIQDGCNMFCSYCIIPYTRGRIRSRDVSDILTEAEHLAAQGVSEIVLTGIHVSSYGRDWEQTNADRDVPGGALLSLLRRLHAIPQIHRIRLSSLEPRIVTQKFAAELKKLPKVCPHFHLSLQSGCDATLKRMNRKYTAAGYAECCKLLRTVYDRPALTTDVIVGFPGETEEEFAETVRYLEEIDLYEMHVFKFSPRKGTPAAKMPGQLTEAVKASRSDVLIDMSERHSRAYRETFAGEKAEILVEEILQIDGRSYYVGFTKNYIRVAVPADEDTLAVNTLTEVILTAIPVGSDCVLGRV